MKSIISMFEDTLVFLKQLVKLHIVEFHSLVGEPLAQNAELIVSQRQFMEVHY